MRNLLSMKPKNSHSQQIGRGFLGFLIFLGVLTALFQCTPSSKTASSTSSEPSKPKLEPKLDYSQPVFTGKYALVCNQSLLIAAAYSRKVEGGLNDIYEAFTAIWNRSEKIKKIGCEEWREGIPVYFVKRMQFPFDEFVSFSTNQSGMSEYFTMEPHLKNKPLPLVSGQTEPLASSPPELDTQKENQLGRREQSGDVVNLSEAEFTKQFRCPETYTTPEESKQGLADSLDWYAAHHQTVSPDAFLSFRKKLLVAKQCEVTLRNLENDQK